MASSSEATVNYFELRDEHLFCWKITLIFFVDLLFTWRRRRALNCLSFALCNINQTPCFKIRNEVKNCGIAYLYIPLPNALSSENLWFSFSNLIPFYCFLRHLSCHCIIPYIIVVFQSFFSLLFTLLMTFNIGETSENMEVIYKIQLVWQAGVICSISEVYSSWCPIYLSQKLHIGMRLE